MVQQVTDEYGKLHEFPDDATPEEMNGAIEKMYSSQKNPLPQAAPAQNNRQIADTLIGQLHQASGLSPNQEPTTPIGQMGKAVTTMARDFGAGLLSALQTTGSMLPDVTSQYPNLDTNVLKNVDPYKEFDTENKGVFSPGGLVQTAGELALPGPPIAKALKGGSAIVKKGIDAIQPEKYAQSLADDLKGGASNLQEASKNIASAIKEKFADRISEPKTYYDFLDKQVGDGKIFEKPDPLITTAMDKEEPLMNKVKDLNVGTLYDNFKAIPNYRNAHALQSELGLLMNEIQTGIRQGTSTRADLQKVGQIRDDLVGSIKDYLDKKGLQDGMNYSNMYDTATNLYRENVAPYLSNKLLRGLVREGKTNVNNIENIFKNPADIENPLTGKSEKGPITKILNDLPQQTKNQILYKQAGGYTAGNADKFANNLSDALTGDYAHLGDNNLYQKINDIKSRVVNKKIAKKAGYIAGVGSVSGLSLADMLMHHYQGNK